MASGEQDLMDRVLAGERGAFACLVREYEAPIYRSILRIVGDHDMASDITQQAFISAYEHLGSFDPEAKVLESRLASEFAEWG